MSFGLTEDGFVIKRQPDIKASLEQSFIGEFGSINVDSASVFGQFIGSVSQPLIDLWELAELVYLSQYANSAEGTSLDNVAQLTGVIRLGSVETMVDGVLVGDQGTVIGVGSQSSVSDVGDQYTTTEEKTIDKADVVKCTVSVANVLDSTLYTVTIDSNDYQYITGVSAIDIEIIAGLVFEINTNQTKVTATDNLNGTMGILVDDLITPFIIDVDTNLQFDELGTPVKFEAKEKGEQFVPAGTLTVIDTPISGWDSVTNLIPGVVGRDVEEDIELRARRDLSQSVIGASTIEAIKSRILQEIDGVTSSEVYDNRSDYYKTAVVITVTVALDSTLYTVYFNGVKFEITSDPTATIGEIALALTNEINLGTVSVVASDNLDGTFNVTPDFDGALFHVSIGENLVQSGARPPHSFECVVVGGTDQDIGDKIWAIKAAGIRTWGTTSVEVTDSQEDIQVMNFSRPENKYAWVRVTYKKNSEEIFPINGGQLLEDGILELGQESNVGEDVIIIKFYTPVNDVSGISDATIEVAITDTPGGTPTYGIVNIPIGQVELAIFDSSRITIIDGTP